MSTQNTRNKIDQLVRDVGRAGANAIFPYDIEYYAVSLELTNSKNQTIDYLTFPVTPSSIDYDDTKITTIQKTMGGVVSIDNETFVPKTISLSGTFGRKLKLLLGPPTVDVNSTSNGIFDKATNAGLQIRTSILNARIKSGYGTTKLLEAIISKSSGLDQYNQPNRLYLYIPPLGHSFLVKCVGGLKLSQQYESSNMMWNYNLSLKAIAPVDQLQNNVLGTLIRSTGMNLLQKNTNAIVSTITNAL